MARATATTLITMLAALAAAVPAGASRGQELTFEAPRDLLAPATRASAFDDVAALGTRSLRVILYWRDVAPSADAERKPSFDASDPAGYDWSKYDPVVEEAQRRGWRLQLTVSGPVPRWATLARRDTLTRPSPKEFGLFMRAVARRYGQRVARWAIWNEPNHPSFLRPQYFRGQPASPTWYRRLFLAGERGLRLGGVANPTVLMGETAPRGTGKVVAPLRFLRGTLCLNAEYVRDRSCASLPADGYAHHAYTPAAGPFFVPRGGDDVTIGVLSRLVGALDRAGRSGAIAARMPIYLTEFGIQSVPDPIYGVSEQRQAEYRAISEQLAWEQPRVRAFSQYLLRDDLPRKGVPANERYGGFESGLRYANGKAKQSHTAFPLPLTALRRDGSVRLWGLVRLASGETSVTVLAGAQRLRTYKRLTTDDRGYFTASVPYVPGRRYRLRWVAPDGKARLGSVTRVYPRP